MTPLDFNEITPIRTAPEKPAPNKALVLFAHGCGLCLTYETSDSILTLIEDAGGNAETFDLDEIGADYEHGAKHDHPDGLFIYELHVVDDGPGDWPGSREVAVGLRNGRPTTAEEWAMYRKGDYPWGPVCRLCREPVIDGDVCNACARKK